MEESRRILEELRRRDWVDSGLRHDEVMDALARGESAAIVLHNQPLRPANSPFQSTMVVHDAADDPLLERLTALAREPWLRQPWPTTPDIPLQRLADDYSRTAGGHLYLALRWDPYPDHAFWLCDITIDGTRSGATALETSGSPDELLVLAAGQIWDGWLMEQTQGGWPACPGHPTWPMGPHVVDGTAMWVCGKDANHRIPIGRFGL